MRFLFNDYEVIPGRGVFRAGLDMRELATWATWATAIDRFTDSILDYLDRRERRQADGEP